MPLRLALVEDDEDVRTALDRLLRSMGHGVELYASAEEFAGGGERFDCLILDMRLPGVSGLELAERIRLQGSVVPIVFITGGSGRSTGERMPAASHSTFSLEKPFSDDDLMEAITRAVDAAGAS